MPYLGISPTRTDNRKIDTPLQGIGGGSGFNGSETQFYLTIEGEPVYPDSELLLQAILNGSQLNPKVDFFIQNNIITFTSAPLSGSTFFALLGDRVSLNKPGTNTVTTNTIKNSAVTTEKIADNAITSEKIAPGTVIASDVADGAVTTAKLDGTAGSEAVTTAKIRDLNVTTGKIADSAVTTGKIADGSVDSLKLKSSASIDADRAVTTNHIRDLNVTTGKLAADSVDSNKLRSSLVVDADRAVTTNHIRNSNITNEKLATNAVTSDKIATGSISNTKIANGSVTPEKINITVPSDPLNPIDGQLIFNTFENSPKVYNSSQQKWDQILTENNASTLVGWSLLSSIPTSVSSFTERNILVSPQTVIIDYAFNQSFISPKHVVISSAGKISSSTDISNWISVNSGTSVDLNSISWGGSFFFAGGNSNTLLTSSNADTWTVSPGPFGSSGGDITATFFANNVQLIGSSFGEIASSTGSTTFNLRVSNLLSPINSFSYNNGLFAAGGSSGDISISTSADAISWSQTLNISGLKKVYLQPYQSGFIAVIDDQTSDDVVIKTTLNGSTWTDLIVNPPNLKTIRSFKYYPITQAYLITDNDGVTWRSSNGKDWSFFNQPVFNTGTNVIINNANYIDAAGIEYFVIMGTKNIDGTLSPYFSTAIFENPNTNLQVNKNYIIDTSYGSVTCTLPNSPNVGDIIRIADGSNTWGTINAIINATNKSFLVSTGIIDNSLILDYSGVNIDIVWTGTYWRVY